jgi:hypothetical protein
MWLSDEERKACVEAVLRHQAMPKIRAKAIVADVFTAYERIRAEIGRQRRLREIVRDYEQ